MRTRWMMLGLVVLFLGALGGALLAPPPASGVSREIIQLQQQVALLLQGQQDLRSAVDQYHAELKTLVQQALSSVNKLTADMGALQKTVQDVQANSGSRIDSLSTQVQGLSDNLQDVQARVGKLSQQLTDIQSAVQSIDAKVSSPPPATSQPVASGPPLSSETLYANALRDFNGGKYDLARQEFSDYLKYFPATDYASNAQFYLGEIQYAEGNYRDAVSAYDKVVVNYPKSFKLASAYLRKGQAYLRLGMKASAAREFREVVRRFPGTDEARRAHVELRRLSTGSR